MSGLLEDNILTELFSNLFVKLNSSHSKEASWLSDCAGFRDSTGALAIIKFTRDISELQRDPQ